MSKFWKEIAAGVIGAALFAVLAFVAGLFERRLTELDQAAVANRVIETDYFKDRLLAHFKQDEDFRGAPGPAGPAGPEGAVGPGAPIGTIVAWPVSRNPLPAGWLPCDGAILAPGQFKELFNVLGTTFGGDGVSSFKLPDYQGYFLRGLDTAGRVDPDGKGRTAGSVQKDMFEQHSHKMLNNQEQRFAYGTREGGDGHNVRLSTGVDRDQRDIIFETVGGAETRPKNVAVVWIIRAGPVVPSESPPQ